MSRFRRYSLRGLMIVFTCAAIALGILGYKINAAKRQAAAVLQIEALGGRPLRVLVDGNSNQVMSGQSGTNQRPAGRATVETRAYASSEKTASTSSATGHEREQLHPAEGRAHEPRLVV